MDANWIISVSIIVSQILKISSEFQFLGSNSFSHYKRIYPQAECVIHDEHLNLVFDRSIQSSVINRCMQLHICLDVRLYVCDKFL